METKHIHFIGICGVAMSALALALKKQGHKITGSDKGFFPPISTHLQKNQISFYPGWHPEKMVVDGDPDLVVVGNVAGSQNPEFEYVKTHGLNYKSYPEVVAEQVIKKDSIVCVGTYGKTTTAALSAWIFSKCGLKPSYMFGGLVQNNMPSAEITDSGLSIVEGDEYKSARWDNQAKFFHYSPTQLLLTSTQWDHADIYPIEKEYFQAFQKLILQMPDDGVIFMSSDVPEQISLTAKEKNCKIITYGPEKENNYSYQNIDSSAKGTLFEIVRNEKATSIQTSMFGEHNVKNITGCFALAEYNGIQTKDIVSTISSFPGIRRRLEKRSKGNIFIFDDIAHSPAKAQHTLATLRQAFSQKIIAVFEPNTGNRKPSAKPGYDHAFQVADIVVIPNLTKVKTDKDDPEPACGGQELSETIAKTHPLVQYIPDDEHLVDYILSNTKSNDVVVFLGSHGFRGMIEAIVEKTKNTG